MIRRTRPITPSPPPLSARSRPTTAAAKEAAEAAAPPPAAAAATAPTLTEKAAAATGKDEDVVGEPEIAQTARAADPGKEFAKQVSSKQAAAAAELPASTQVVHSE